MTLIARNGRDVAANTMGAQPAGAEEWMGYIFSERPVYRPGHTVHFKGLLRRIDLQIRDNLEAAKFDDRLRKLVRNLPIRGDQHRRDFSTVI